MEKSATRKVGRRQIELFAHSPNPADAFTDPNYELTVTYRFSLKRDEWKNRSAPIDLLPPQKLKVEPKKAFEQTEGKRWLVFTYLCKSEKEGESIFEKIKKELNLA